MRTSRSSLSTRFSPEQVAFAEAVRDFCRRESGTIEQREKLTVGGREVHNQELYTKFAAAGLLGVSIPEEYGGSGGGIVEQCLMFEEIYFGRAPMYGAGTSHTIAGIYREFGSEQQKKRMLSAISRGDVVAIGFSEPEAGSDLANLSTRARRDGATYRIDGHKTWCSAAQFATHILVIARSQTSTSKHEGLVMVEVPADAPGVTIRPIATMSGNEVNEVYLNDVVVPAENVVGQDGNAWPQLMKGLNAERIVCAAQSIGRAERVLDDLLEYVRNRKQFGQPIGTFQAIRHRIATVGIEIESAKSLTYDAVSRIDLDDTSPQELIRLTSMAKTKATEVAKQAALEGVQLMGGYGCAVEYGMEEQLRHSIAPTIYAGTNEIQREIIASSYGLR